MVLLDVSPISPHDLDELSHMSSARVSAGFLVTSYQGLSSTTVPVGWATNASKVLDVPNFLHLIIMEPTVLLGYCNSVFLRSVPAPQNNLVSKLCRKLLRPHGLVSYINIHGQLWDHSKSYKLCQNN